MPAYSSCPCSIPLVLELVVIMTDLGLEEVGIASSSDMPLVITNLRERERGGERGGEGEGERGEVEREREGGREEEGEGEEVKERERERRGRDG